MMSDRSHYLIWAGLWLILVLTSLYSRPLLPLDETRYAGVAWEMWARSDFLVPHLNGEAYSHKAPLLFWLIHLGWLVFGVNEWWPRLVPALFALGSVFMTAAIARRLWPGRTDVARITPAILLGTSLWLLFTPMMLFDMIMVFWVLTAVAGLLQARCTGNKTGWVVFAIAMALGVLTKGPVMLLQVLVPALILPRFVVPPLARPAARWYPHLGLYTVIAILLALIWAIPAALHGGDDYAREIFWGQTSGRMVDSFAHRAPWWWYLAYLPVILFPWLYWPRLWTGMRRILRSEGDRAVHFCTIWFAAVLLAFSLISGKRLHYLLPVLPVLALLAARALSSLRSQHMRRLDLWPVSLIFSLFAVLFALAPGLQGRYHWPEWIAQLPYSLSAVLLASAIALMTGLRHATVTGRVLKLTVVMVAAFSLVQAVISVTALPNYDLHPISSYIRGQQSKGVPVVNVGKYHDQYHFFGRLTRPIDIVKAEEAPAWAQAHPEGLLIAYYEDDLPDIPLHPVFQAPYRGKRVAIWRGTDVIEFPILAREE